LPVGVLRHDLAHLKAGTVGRAIAQSPQPINLLAGETSSASNSPQPRNWLPVRPAPGTAFRARGLGVRPPVGSDKGPWSLLPTVFATAVQSTFTPSQFGLSADTGMPSLCRVPAEQGALDDPAGARCLRPERIPSRCTSDIGQHA